MNGAVTRLSIISWNIHRGRGEDGVIDPARTVDVLADEVLAQPCDLVVLQEADEERPPHRGVLDLSDISARTGLRHIQTDRRDRWGDESHGFLGVYFLATAGVEVEGITLLDLPGHCHRGAVIADLRKNGKALRVIGTHLSLTQVLRIAQMRTAPATFPVRRPLLPLDRFLGTQGARVLDTQVLDGAGVRMASDHRPLRAEIEIGTPG
jgi:endonuclease/exonuclease/phosphatase family metal-dependent hydrolase